MDEARRVLERLERIDTMRTGQAAPGALLEELRGLLRDGQAWLAAEPAVEGGKTAAALDRLASVLAAADLDVREGVRAGASDRRTES